METNPSNKGVISSNFSGIGVVTREIIHKRARELALLANRTHREVTPEDLAQARRELAGGSDLDAAEELIEALPESERWDPNRGSEGRQAPEVSNEDEDAEGRSETEQLVEDGAREAEHDKMVQAEESAQEEERAGGA
jgi:hypothetical protein